MHAAVFGVITFGFGGDVDTLTTRREINQLPLRSVLMCGFFPDIPSSQHILLEQLLLSLIALCLFRPRFTCFLLNRNKIRLEGMQFEARLFWCFLFFFSDVYYLKFSFNLVFNFSPAGEKFSKLLIASLSVTFQAYFRSFQLALFWSDKTQF